VNIDWKSPFLKGTSQFGPKFRLEGDVPTKRSRVAKLDASTFQVV